jgi:hypothetical protein
LGDVELPPLAPSLPAGLTAEEPSASGVLGLNIWSGVSLIIIIIINNNTK